MGSARNSLMKGIEEVQEIIDTLDGFYVLYWVVALFSITLKNKL